MEIWELLLLSVALAMDAFAVSICKGLATKEKYIKTGLVCGLWFGIFQALMPLLGWLLGSTISQYIEKYSAYVAFVLLAYLGGKMIKEAIEAMREEKEILQGIKKPDEKTEKKDASLSIKVMFVFAIATSIDALAVGLTFAALNVNIWLAISSIGIVTFIFSFIGSIVGAKIGSKFKSKAEIAGGIILIGIGLKILIEYLINIL